MWLYDLIYFLSNVYKVKLAKEKKSTKKNQDNACDQINEIIKSLVIINCY